jgi:hypothetical protein
VAQFEDQTIKFQQDVFLALQKSATVYINYIGELRMRPDGIRRLVI